MKDRIRIKLYNQTYKEIDMTDFSFISEDLFANRDDIVKVEFPEGVETIGSNAFENCSRLEEVVLPSTLKAIEREAFINCANLKKVTYSDSVSVDPSAFMGCLSL